MAGINCKHCDIGRPTFSRPKYLGLWHEIFSHDVEGENRITRKYVITQVTHWVRCATTIQEGDSGPEKLAP